MSDWPCSRSSCCRPSTSPVASAAVSGQRWPASSARATAPPMSCCARSTAPWPQPRSRTRSATAAMPSRARRPRRLVYPTIGILLSVALVLGLLVLQDWVGHRAAIPGHPWRLTDELRRQPLVYGYLLAATVALTTVLGWVVGRKEDLLETLSVTDPLTGLANRRRMLAAFGDELNRSARYGTPLALLLIDLDRLKEINDRRGHAQGDRALQLVADSLRRSCRATDLAARTGGDEFLVLAVETSAGEALALAHRICATVRRLGAAAGNEKEK